MHIFFTDAFFYIKCRHGCDVIITWSRILVESLEKMSRIEKKNLDF